MRRTVFWRLASSSGSSKSMLGRIGDRRRPTLSGPLTTAAVVCNLAKDTRNIAPEMNDQEFSFWVVTLLQSEAGVSSTSISRGAKRTRRRRQLEGSPAAGAAGG